MEKTGDAKGFTLIELLVVITIIAALSVMGFVAYQDFVKKSRDAKRQTDLKFIQSALEQYYGDQFEYPTEGVGNTCAGGVINNPIDDLCALQKGSKVYLQEIPKDPLPSPHPQYQYKPAARTAETACDNGAVYKCIKYCLYAKVEKNANARVDQGCPIPSSLPGYDLSVGPP